MAELKYTDVLSVSDKESLEEFLTHCDLVKFAKHTPVTEQIQQTFDLVKEFIEKTKTKYEFFIKRKIKTSKKK